MNLEQKIIQLIVAGKTNKEIGKEIGYSPSAVKRRISKIYKTYEAVNRYNFICKYSTT